MIWSNLCDYSDGYILVSATITITGSVDDDDDDDDDDDAEIADERNKEIIFENGGLFSDCISNINNTQIYNAKDIDLVMPMYNLIDTAPICSHLLKKSLMENFIFCAVRKQ